MVSEILIAKRKHLTGGTDNDLTIENIQLEKWKSVERERYEWDERESSAW